MPETSLDMQLLLVINAVLVMLLVVRVLLMYNLMLQSVLLQKFLRVMHVYSDARYS